MSEKSMGKLKLVLLATFTTFVLQANADDGNPLHYKNLTVESIQARTGYPENNQHYIVYFNRNFSEHTCSDGGAVGKVNLDGSEQSKMLTNMLTLALATGKKVDVFLSSNCSYHNVINTAFVYR